MREQRSRPDGARVQEPSILPPCGDPRLHEMGNSRKMRFPALPSKEQRDTDDNPIFHSCDADLLVLLGSWGEMNSAADLDMNGIVGIGDLLILLANWG